MKKIWEIITLLCSNEFITITDTVIIEIVIVNNVKFIVVVRFMNILIGIAGVIMDTIGATLENVYTKQ